MDLSRVYKSLEKKVNADLGHRPDLSLCDCRNINKTTAHFMVEYDGATPKASDISEFFLKTFDSKITPCMATAKVYAHKKAVTIIGQMLNLTKPIDEVKKGNLKPVIAGALYIDAPLDDMWEVKESEGSKVLVRKVKENIMDIVEARKSAMMNSYSNKCFASLANFNSNKLVENGDIVSIFHNDLGKVVDAVVVAITNKDLKVKYEGGMFPVQPGEILEVKSKDMDKKQLEDYYTKAFGDPSYAKKLVRGK